MRVKREDRKMEDVQNGKKCCGFNSAWAAACWWASLVVAVIAVPSVAFVAAAIVPGNLGQVIVFVVACWISTFMGMLLMQK